MKQFKLSYPLDTVMASQGFGENPQMYSNPKYGGIKGHNGIDFRTGHGTPVYASHDGLASFQIDNGGGHGVVIITKEPFEHNGKETYFKSIYWHLCDGLVEPEFASPLQGKTGFTEVKNGQLIGYADNTGASTGDHLHFGLKTVDKGEEWGTWYNTNQNNGYNGSIDPQPYFDGYTPKQIHTMEKMIVLLTELVSKLTQRLKKLVK